MILRDGLVELLTSRGHEVIAAVGDGEALLAAFAESPPDVAVVDIRMPPTHTDEGLRAAIEIRRSYPRVGVLVFSQYIETRYAAELLGGRSDRVGYLLKDRIADVSDFIDALERIAAGGTVLDPEVITQLLGRVAEDRRGGVTDNARAGGAGADGRGPVERRDREGAVRRRGFDRKACDQHLLEVGAAPVGC